MRLFSVASEGAEKFTLFSVTLQTMYLWQRVSMIRFNAKKIVAV